MKKCGFTLIELLAVIVILAIIALIATPIIMDVVENSKKAALKDSAYGLEAAAGIYYVNHAEEINNPIVFDILNGKQIGEHQLEYKGSIKEGKLILNTNGTTTLCITDGKYYAYKKAMSDQVASGIGNCKYNEEINDFEIVSNENNQEETVEKCTYDNGTTFVYEYTGTEQEFITPCSGKYKIELWGAGSIETNDLQNLGGGYTSGEINLDKSSQLYIYVGGQGIRATNTSGTTGGGYNGGGNGGYYAGSLKNYTVGGGGSTDIRLENGNWNSFDSLKSRIMVAGGSAGRVLSGYVAGGLSGYGNTTSYPAGTQTTGYAFGYGQSSSTAFGGGGGYYGGYTNVGGSHGAGGSSFISGHDGCDAIAEDSTVSNIIHTGQENHYSGYIFTHTVMVDGKGYNWTNVIGEYTGMPTYDGLSTMNGNTGNGYAKITYLGN